MTESGLRYSGMVASPANGTIGNTSNDQIPLGPPQVRRVIHRLALDELLARLRAPRLGGWRRPWCDREVAGDLLDLYGREPSHPGEPCRRVVESTLFRAFSVLS
jgi:hypothetical protein